MRKNPNKPGPPSRQPAHAKLDVVADRHRLVLIGMAAVWIACLVFAVMRLMVTLQTGLLTPWWGNAAGLVAITLLYLWYRGDPDTRSSTGAHGTALVATLALLLPVSYGMISSIWWLSLVGFAMVLLGRRQEAWTWGLTIPLLVIASVLAAPYVQMPGAAGEPLIEEALSKIVFVLILLGLALGFRLTAEQRAVQLHHSQEELGKLKSQFEELADQRLERLERLNAVLRAIRQVNRLIGQEKNPKRLAKQICQVLTRDRGYRHAWVALTCEDEPARFVAHSGVEDAIAPLAEKMKQGIWPACRDRALAAGDGLAMPLSAADCQGCPLRESDRDAVHGVVALQHEDRLYGLLGITIPAGFDLNRDLLLEMAGDIAFALHAIETEAAQLRSEQTVRAIFDSASDGILLAEAETGRFVMANDTVCRMLGYTAGEMLSLSVDNIHPPENLEYVRSQFVKQARGEISLAQDLPVLRKDGSVFPADVNSSPITLDGRVHLLGIFRDISERREMQAQLAQADRLSSMGMLAAGVAHEINNPLSYVLYNLESLGDDLPGLLTALRGFHKRLSDRLGPEVVEEIAGTDAEKLNSVTLDDLQARTRDAVEGVHRIRDISRGLGTFSRVEKDQLRPVDLRQVIEVAVNMAYNEVKYRARLVKDYQRDLPPVLASEGRLSQVFLNLIINATHAIDEGDLENNHIRVRTWAEGHTVCARVEDTGSGIAPENLKRLFEPFFTTKKIGMGSGLGLAISKNIVEGYGGTIEVESEPGKGTSFAIRLPCRSGVEVSAGDGTRPDREPEVRGRILIVDDEAGIRNSMKRMLRTHETVLAESGAEARRILAEDQDFDVILCDMMMPDISGVDLHTWLQETYPALAQKLVFITGGAFTPRAREHLDQVDNPWLEKPFDVIDLKKIVNKMIILDKAGTQG